MKYRLPYIAQTDTSIMNMLIYKKYNIKPEDEFRADNFPKVAGELNAILLFVSGLPVVYKKEIILSHVKKQSLQDEWITANPDLTSLVSSGVFATDHLTGLFESCRQNKRFQQEYEHYICNAIA